MSDALVRIQALVARGAVRISDHGFDELAEDDISASEVVAGVYAALVVEDYPTAMRGPSVLVLQKDTLGRNIHAVWAIPKDWTEPAVLVTAYRPDPERWSSDFKKRKMR